MEVCSSLSFGGMGRGVAAVPGEFIDSEGNREHEPPRPGGGGEWKRKTRRAHGGCLWLSEARKDATSCEKPRGGANGR